MKLSYKILWFENESSFEDLHLQDIKRLVEKESFEFEHKLCRKRDDFKGRYKDYDLILIDYKLTGAKNGYEIIEEIRKDCYGDILFYSQRPIKELKDEIIKRILSGVFYCHRDDFFEEFKKIFDENMKRIHHPNNLRGLVMAETSDLDKLKKKILKKYFELTHEKKDEFEEKIHRKIEKHISESIGKLNSYRVCKYEFKKLELEGRREKEIESLIDDPIFEFSKKARAIVNLIGLLNLNLIFDFRDYNEKIISKRNDLAHKPEEEIDGIVVFGSLKFDIEECRQIRKDIIKYKKIMEEL